MYMEEIALEVLLLAFFCVCGSSENKPCGNLLDFTNEPLNGLHFWLKFDNSLNFSFSGASKY